MNWFQQNYQWLIGTIVVILCTVISSIVSIRIDRVKHRRDLTKADGERINLLILENEKLKKELDGFKDIDRIGKSLIYHNAGYYSQELPNGSTNYFCSNCWDNNKKPINVKIDDVTGYFHCPQCDNRGIFNQSIVEHNQRLIDAQNESIQSFFNYNGRL